MLVENGALVRMDTAAELRRVGFQVIEAAQADAAMEFIKAGERVDLVFTHVKTTDLLDGLVLAECVRAKFPIDAGHYYLG